MQIHWLWYALLQGLNDREKAELLTHFSDAEELYFADRDRLSALEDLTPEGMAVLLDKDLAPAEKILRECTDKEISLLTYGDEAYPLALRSIADPPMVLYYRGTLPDFDAVPPPIRAPSMAMESIPLAPPDTTMPPQRAS